jgi:uncharacterized membrane protein YdjX (TVP38/TMEM64 family)
MGGRRLPFRRLWPIAVILAGFAGGMFLLGDRLSFDMLAENQAALLAWRDENLALAALVFVVAYAALVAFSLPGAAVASITGGLLFGLAAGTVLNVAAATIGASAIFLAARHGFGAALAARIDAGGGAAKRIKDGLTRNQTSFLLLMRLVPAFPFVLANLVPALAGVRLLPFVLTTFFGIIPGALAFTWVGAGVGAVLAEGGSPDLSVLWSLPVLGPILALCALAALPVLLPLVLPVLRRAFRR